MNRWPGCAGIAWVLVLWIAAAAGGADLTAAFLNSTYLIQSHEQYGTAFIIGEPVVGAAQRSNLVLVTAAHTLEAMTGQKAVLHARVRENGGWRKIPWPIDIRRRGRALWTRHPQVDLAALRVGLPEGAGTLVPTVALIASDDDYLRYGIAPGTRVQTLGFPLALGSDGAGFPILRGGRIASYPLTPARRTKTFFVDMAIFPGNSGGPVIITPDGSGGGNGRRSEPQLLLGIVSREVLAAGGRPEAGRPLSLARVIHAAFIHDLIARLPPP